MATTREKGPRFFVGFGFDPESVLTQFYKQINAELLEHCGIEPLSRTHSPHLTVFPPPNPPFAGGVREAASRLFPVAATLPMLTLETDGWGWFEGAQTSTLYLKVVQSPEFRRVFRRLVRVMDGLLVPNNPYVPHISFSRWLTREQRLRAGVYIAWRSGSSPPIPFAQVVLDELTLFARHRGGYRAYVRIALPRG